MTTICKLCGKVAAQAGLADENAITYGICKSCSVHSLTTNMNRLLENIEAPILLMQGNPRQVVSANRHALHVFGKTLPQVENMRGGQVFDCEHSFSEAGCGKDENCEHCTIRNAIVDTFNTGTPHSGISTPLPVRKAGRAETRMLQVSTEKVGELALVRIERYEHSAK